MSTEQEALIAEARDPSTSRDRLWALVKHPDEEVRRALLDNPNLCSTDDQGQLDVRLLDELAEEFPEEVAAHPAFALHALVEPNDEFQGVVGAVVKRTKDVGLMEYVFRTRGQSSWEVRQAVAQNPNTPENILRILGNPKIESDTDVRMAVAENPNTPVDILRSLGNETTESNQWVRESVAKNPNTPTDVLFMLSNRKTELFGTVREAVAENPSAPVDLLRAMTNPENELMPSVREAAKKALASRGLA